MEMRRGFTGREYHVIGLRLVKEGLRIGLGSDGFEVVDLDAEIGGVRPGCGEYVGLLRARTNHGRHSPGAL